MIGSDIQPISNVEMLYRTLMSRNSNLKDIGVPQKILSGQRVSIPDDILKSWGLVAGDFVLVKQVGKEMVIAPARFERA